MTTSEKINVDPKSLAAKFNKADEHFSVIVVGGGDAGIEAALSAAESSDNVLLVDENPISGDLMRIDVPHFFGQRFTGAVDQPDSLFGQMLETSPRLADAFEAGIDIRLGASIWGAFRADGASAVLPQPLLGLAEGDDVKMLSFDRLIVATGARDLSLLFPGAGLPGVMGATALRLLLEKYDAFNGRRVVILGSGKDALELASLALEKGIKVAGIVEVNDCAQNEHADLGHLAERGVPFFPRYCIAEARGGVEGVEAVTIRNIHDDAQRELECDTVCIAIDRIPNIELLSLLGCEIIFDEALGGYVPSVDGDSCTSFSNIFAIGDCAGVVSADMAYRFDWTKALARATDPDSPICLCEEVSRTDLLSVRPPTYLNWLTWPEREEFDALVEANSLHPDLLKRLTRVSMGLCQGRRCRDGVALNLSAASGAPLSKLPAMTFRNPIRPLRMSALANEPAAITENWVAWFGIPGQWDTPAELAAGTGPAGADKDFSI